jgi:hypothetical protein
MTQPEKIISTILVDYSFFQCLPGYPASKPERLLVFFMLVSPLPFKPYPENVYLNAC